jgi:hypothetical protein
MVGRVQGKGCGVVAVADRYCCKDILDGKAGYDVDDDRQVIGPALTWIKRPANLHLLFGHSQVLHILAGRMK